MKKTFSLILCLILMVSCFSVQSSAVSENDAQPRVIDFSLTTPNYSLGNETRATGLILFYSLNLSASGSTLTIRAETYCNAEVVKSGFKNLVVQRRKAGSTSWSDYYDYGDLYNDTYSASIVTTLVVPSGYQYRLSCKHYAKKSLLVTQSVSNTSNVVGV